ncbi:APC family permease [Salinibacillus xinjiangensis]|uniref:APC family permease n=1 Tax=Salinibacillus xinjiangensis TaxID=1229268 RepID=UPI001E634406|nr:APC family permease [Salinibacillus xinjiangensis]
MSDKSIKRKQLTKTLKPHWVWAIALGSSIGWGCFVLPTTWMGQAGPIGVIMGLAIGAALMMLIAVSYGFLIKHFPVSGGEFAYTFISLGRVHAFICGWFLTLGYICIVALNASAFTLMLKFILPEVIQNVKLYTIAGWDVYLTEIMIATLILGLFAFFNIKGTGISGRLQFVFCTILVLGVLALTGISLADPVASIQNINPGFKPGITTFSAIIAIVAVAPWAYVGFDNVPQAAEEFHFSSKKAFSLIILALLFAAILYSLMILTTAVAFPWQETVNANYMWGTGTVVFELLGTTGMLILVASLSMGVFTGLNGFYISSSRVLFAMSRAKVLPDGFSKLHSKFKTPYVGVIFTAIIAAIAPWFGREVLLWIVDMSSIGVSIAYFYTTYTAYKLFTWSENGNSQPLHDVKPVVAPMKKAFAVVGMMSSIVFILLLLVPGSPAFMGIPSLIALGVWVILGLLFFVIRKQEFMNLTQNELVYLILGKKSISLKDEPNQIQ